MKLGFVSSILDSSSFEEMIDAASELGFKCVEIACWPKSKAERRYAGVSHIDVDNLDDDKMVYIKNYCEKKEVEISSLAFYPNNMDGNLEKRNANIQHLKKVIAASNKLGIGMVTTFIGKDQTKTVEENMKLFEKIWPPIIKFAEENNVKIAIENCPMLFGEDQWPGGQNLASTPEIWKQMFQMIQSDYFGLNYDPSHFIWQMMDYIEPIYEFKDKIFHVHFKDIKLFKNKLNSVGITAYPLSYMDPKIPGLGDVNWRRFVSALTDIRYKGYSCIEIEDRAFEDTREEVIKSLELSKKYLEQFVI